MGVSAIPRGGLLTPPPKLILTKVGEVRNGGRPKGFVNLGQRDFLRPGQREHMISFAFFAGALRAPGCYLPLISKEIRAFFCRISPARFARRDAISFDFQREHVLYSFAKLRWRASRAGMLFSFDFQREYVLFGIVKAEFSPARFARRDAQGAKRN